ncbi:hypothetical protein [Bradyrhizobium cytisi]|uniref:Uncharacterized protein n=1 Tax=Bradyrhizobium cytisi TaxID=515489 RepID=A0A5S4WTI2_9BRAD|nr:hypothetical protein [Bradyrhizobium cytisi]TYL83811.1 hypothetical protein FXB38_17270 [Bradyrhizobium cytisi]
MTSKPPIDLLATVARFGRNLAKDEAWLARLTSPVVRVDGARPIAELVEQLCADVARLPG